MSTHEVHAEFPPSHEGYFWHLARMLRTLERRGDITLNTLAPTTRPGQNEIASYVMLLWIDDQPIIIDARDSHHLPVELMVAEPDAKVLKSSFSRELWEHSPEGLEGVTGMSVSDEERAMLDRVVPFVFGRAIKARLDDDDEVARLCPNKATRRVPVATLTGAGQTWQQTDSRLRVLELVDSVLPRSALHFFRLDYCAESRRVPNFAARAARFRASRVVLQRAAHYDDFLYWLAEADFGLNFPGFCFSPPFRLIDGVFADKPTISTKIWADAYKDFPCVMLPICGFLGTGDWGRARTILENLSRVNTADLRSRQQAWYTDHLSADGMWRHVLQAV